MRIILILLTLGCILNNCYANTITVTSNADSGSGSLREAITIANSNGIAITDTIIFNISETIFNQRIIELNDELPPISSNTIIDGTTQPGDVYGTTDAKICIKKNQYAPSFSMLTIENADHVEIYGLVLFYGYWQGLFGPLFRSSSLYGINLIESKNVIIGAPGKGNVINGVVRGIYANSDRCSDIFVQSNYLGHGKFYENTADDIDPVVLPSSYCVVLMNVKNVTIGGSKPEYGNIFGSPGEALYIDSKHATGNGLIKVQFNKFGRKYDQVTKVKVFDFWDAYVSIGQSGNGPLPADYFISDYRVELLDNDIPNHVFIGYQSDSIIVLRNHFEDDNRNDHHNAKLKIVKCAKGGMVGNDDTLNANFFKTKSYNTDYPSIMVYECGPLNILKNVFECNSTLGSTTYIFPHLNLIPFAQVDLTTATLVEGRATPNARIDLYYDDACTACEGRVYLAKVFSDSSGKWKYNGSINGTVIATATTAAGATGPFSQPLIITDKMVRKQPTCGQSNGSVTGITTEGAETYRWINYATKDTVSHSIDLLNVGPGNYYLYAVHGGTCMYPYFVSLEDVTPRIDSASLIVRQPSCGLFNGSINGLLVYNGGYSTYKWINGTGDSISNQLSINNLGGGTYRFVLRDTSSGGGCADTATFVLENQSGPSLDFTSMTIKPAICGNPVGGIQGIKTVNVKGSPFIQWRDSVGNVAGNSLDLINVAAGKYRLYFKDETGCDTIVTPVQFIVDTTQIKINEAAVVLQPTGCTSGSGSIKNISASNATLFVWKNVNTGNVIGQTLNITELAEGSYQLSASNALGCSASSSILKISSAGFDAIHVKDYTIKNASCNNANGRVTISGFDKSATGYTFRWVDSLRNQPQSSVNNAITELGKGVFQLFATDPNGCEQKIFTALVDSLPTPTLDMNDMVILSDVCNTGKGSITGIKTINLVGQASYQWLDLNNVVVSSSLNLLNAKTGSYHLQMQDSYNCGLGTSAFFIPDNTNAGVEPNYSDVVIMKNTAATVKVNNHQPGAYLLYADAAGTQLLSQNTTGIFVTAALAGDQSFYAKHVTGSCTSKLVRINVTVAEESFLLVPKAFTPNDDLLNDRISIKVIGALTLTHFKIYNRYGQLVFATDNPGNSWDGKLQGVKQPGGAYVWMSEGKDILGNTVRASGTILLLR